jgi:hypothetical protein
MHFSNQREKTPVFRGFQAPQTTASASPRRARKSREKLGKTERFRQMAAKVHNTL